MSQSWQIILLVYTLALGNYSTAGHFMISDHTDLLSGAATPSERTVARSDLRIKPGSGAARQQISDNLADRAPLLCKTTTHSWEEEP